MNSSTAFLTKELREVYLSILDGWARQFDDYPERGFVTPYYLNPDRVPVSHTKQLLAITSVLGPLSLFCVIIRLYSSKFRSGSGLGKEDYLIVLAAVRLLLLRSTNGGRSSQRLCGSL
jgi:hypothetical protein